MKIEPYSKEPIYKQITSQLKEQILTGELKGGEQLQSVRVLAKNTNVSVITILKAYKILTADGLITAVKGKGHFVSVKGEKMLSEMQRQQLEQCIDETIHYAKIASINADEVCEMLKTMWNKDSVSR